MYNTHSDIWVAGAFAAVVVDFTVYPFDTLKTRIQSPNYETVFKDTHTGTIRRDVLFRGLYQGVWSVVFSTIPSSGAFFTTYEAVKSVLYSSHSSTSVSVSASASTNTSKPAQHETNQYTNNLNSRRNPNPNPNPTLKLPLPFTHSLPTPLIHALASSSAEMVSCLILTPAEVIKQNAQMIQTSPSQKSSTGNQSSTTTSAGTSMNVSPMRQVLSRFKSRPWTLWSGYFALVGRNLPFTGLQFPLFEYVRSRVGCWRRGRLQKEKDLERGRGRLGDGGLSSSTDNDGSAKEKEKEKEGLVERVGVTGFSAAVAGIVSSTVTTPIDVVKTRVMLSAGASGSEGLGGGSVEKRAAAAAAGSEKKKGSWEVGREILKKDGVRGLFRGGAIRGGWTAVSMGLYLSLYEGGRFYLERRRRMLEGVS